MQVRGSIRLVCMLWEELRKGRTTIWKPQQRLKIWGKYRKIFRACAYFTPVIGICIGAQEGRKGGHEAEEEVERWASSGRRGWRGACGRRRAVEEGEEESRDLGGGK